MIFLIFSVIDTPSTLTYLKNVLGSFNRLRYACYVRKRRRQAWHARSQLQKKSRNQFGKQRNERKRPTKDNGSWSAPLSKKRRLITIKDKLEVIDFRAKLLAERDEARKLVQQVALTESMTVEEKRAFKKDRLKAKKTARKLIQNECAKKFPQVVGCCKVAVWAATAQREHWSDLPDAYISRNSTTTNQWRVKIGAPLKGRSVGGCVPLTLQRELDTLLMEVTAGASEVSERKEVVTTEQVASWLSSALLTTNISPQGKCEFLKMIFFSKVRYVSYLGVNSIEVIHMCISCTYTFHMYSTTTGHLWNKAKIFRSTCYIGSTYEKEVRECCCLCTLLPL